MKLLLLAAGRFDDALKDRIAAGRHPRVDVLVLQRTLGADLLDDGDVLTSRIPEVRLLRRTLGTSTALAYLGLRESPGYDAIFTTGEDIGLPLATLMKWARRKTWHAMIAHTLTPWKKRPFFTAMRVQTHVDRFICYSSLQERFMIEQLAIPAQKVIRMRFHADQEFFRPDPSIPVEPDLLCSAGQLLRDYDCLLQATRGLGVRVHIAAGSPWIHHRLAPRQSLPPNVDWRSYDRLELRGLYARAALAVVPIVENDYQTGIATILEMMAMGKCVIASRTRGQRDTIVDGVTGIYLPPGDPAALRHAIERLLAHPEEARRIGAAARRFIEEEASLETFVEKLAALAVPARAHDQASSARAQT